MENIRKGDIVGRKSYNKDILFIVERILKSSKGNSIAILKGLNIRIQADSDIDDLELMDKKAIEESEKRIERRFAETLKKYGKEQENEQKGSLLKRSNKVIYTGKILHLDGDSHLSNLKKSNNTNTSEQVIFSHI